MPAERSSGPSTNRPGGRPDGPAGAGDQSMQSIDVAAAPGAVMAVIADVARYPEWVGSVTRAEVLEAGADGRPLRAAFTLDAGPVRDRYELRYTWSGDQRVEWTLTAGQLMRAQDGRYELVPTAGGTHVTYWLRVELAVPLLGLLKRKAERVVMDTALRELKRRVEAGA